MNLIRLSTWNVVHMVQVHACGAHVTCGALQWNEDPQSVQCFLNLVL